jgi:hypothetical protein
VLPRRGIKPHLQVLPRNQWIENLKGTGIIATDRNQWIAQRVMGTLPRSLNDHQ